jgi:hypothetical protein
MTPAPSCHHTRPTGARCGSPALRGEQFCFFHHPTRRAPQRVRSSRIRFHLPAVNDAESLQMVLAEVIRRLADNTLDTPRASLILQTLQIARTNLASMPQTASRSSDLADLSTLLAILAPPPNPSASQL